MLDLSKDARDFLQDLQAKQFKQVASKIHDLLQNPFPADARHLSGYPGYRRIDSGEFRVCYTVTTNIVRIVVVGVIKSASQKSEIGVDKSSRLV
ncbi:MAG: type II toxin-antitoxin system RelE/ParE family toxin [Nitrososphaera sp.]|nr:type II toxin-antitoxin system RelE/ParE family toxin [Nitrososphaera sp.]